MKTNKIFLIVALLGAVLAGCQKVSEIQNPEDKPENHQAWTLKVLATKNVDTRALNYEGNTMKPYWANGELVDVYFSDEKIGTLVVTSADNTDPATLEGTVSIDGLSQGDELSLVFPGREDGEWTYLGQDGSLPEAFDYATASVTVETLDATTQTITTTTENAKFENQQSIYRFSFKVGGAGDAITAKSFIVVSDEEALARYRYFDDGWTWKNGGIFVNATNATAPYLTAIRNGNSGADRYTFSVVGNNSELYLGEKALNNGVVNGKFYNANISVTQKAFTPGTGSIENDEDVL
jgi:hypothetical protein